jgi:beta-N-acetylhexosaminidase
MGPDELCGQVLMIDLVGTRLDASVRKLLETTRPGGILLFDYNIESPASLGQFTGSLRAWAQSNRVAVPLLAIDQEGGPISRLSPRRGFTSFPAPMAMAACADEALFMALVGAMSRELRSVGIDMNLAPVLDVIGPQSSAVLGIRSFGDRPRAVARWGELWVRAMASGGVANAAKHFPGHGGAQLDSHIGLPEVHDDLATLITRDLTPFLSAMRTGCEAFLSAHVFFHELEPEPGRPATLSAHILHGLLRKQMFYDGLLITDSMVMGAITRHREPHQAVEEALRAGADLVLVPDSPERITELHALLTEKARKDDDFRALVARTAERILFWKTRRATLTAPVVPLSSQERTDHRGLAEAVSRKSIAAHPSQLFDLKKGGLVVELPSSWGLAGALSDRGRTISAAPNLSELLSLSNSAREAPWTCVMFRREENAPWIDGVLKTLLGAQPQTILIMAGNPWDKGDLPSPHCLYTFGWTPWTASQLAKILTGEATAQGVMPVDLGSGGQN